MSEATDFAGPAFIDRYARGELAEADNDDFISAWHAEKAGVADLHDYLGLSCNEHAERVKHEDAVAGIVQARREGRPVEFRRPLNRSEQPAVRRDLLVQSTEEGEPDRFRD